MTISCCIAGRVYSKRVQGKLVFYDVRADGAKVQVMADVATSGGDLAAFVALHNGVKIGDIIGVEGFPGTRRHHFPMLSALREPFLLLPDLPQPQGVIGRVWTYLINMHAARVAVCVSIAQDFCCMCMVDINWCACRQVQERGAFTLPPEV